MPFGKHTCGVHTLCCMGVPDPRERRDLGGSNPSQNMQLTILCCQLLNTNKELFRLLPPNHFVPYFIAEKCLYFGVCLFVCLSAGLLGNVLGLTDSDDILCMVGLQHNNLWRRYSLHWVSGTLSFIFKAAQRAIASLMQPLCITADGFFIVYFWQFAVWYLHVPWANHRETLPHDWKCGQLNNSSPKIWGPPQNKFWE